MTATPPLPDVAPLELSDPRAVSILTTEHFALQGLRSSTISDSSSRAALYLAALSGTLVALSLLASATRFGPSFVIAALIIAPTLIFLGVSTYARTLQSALEDTAYALGINRLRHLYLQLVPAARPYFTQSDRDDVWGALSNMGSAGGPWQMLLTTAGAISVVNSVVIAAFLTGLLVIVRLALPWALLVGLAALFLAVWLHYLDQRRRWYAFSEQHPPLFPSDQRASPHL